MSNPGSPSAVRVKSIFIAHFGQGRDGESGWSNPGTPISPLAGKRERPGTGSSAGLERTPTHERLPTAAGGDDARLNLVSKAPRV
jgi:hypothetical protein